MDSFISSKLENISRNKVQNLINSENVILNNKIIDDQSFKLNKVGVIKLFFLPPIETNIKAEELNLNVIYEDNDLIVVDKAAGMVVHPSTGNYEKTLVNGLLYHCKNSLSGIGGTLRPGIVHRIDKMTSGILVIAKNDLAHNDLSNQFKKRTIKREYEALVWNRLLKNEGKIDKNVARSKFDRKKMSVTNFESGKQAITYYKLSKEFKLNDNIFISHIHCKLLTGRTHQIRVHMNYNGNPLIGDSKYKKNIKIEKIPEITKKFISDNFVKLNRHALHAKVLGFFHPFKKKEFFFESKTPKDIQGLLQILKQTKY